MCAVTVIYIVMWVKLYPAKTKVCDMMVLVCNRQPFNDLYSEFVNINMSRCLIHLAV